MKDSKKQKRLKAIDYMQKTKDYKVIEVSKKFGMPYGTVWTHHKRIKNAENKEVPTPVSDKAAVQLQQAEVTQFLKLVGEKVDEKHRHLDGSDGSSAVYYVLPYNCEELQDLISHKNMNAQIGEIFRACYRYGEVAHSDMLRDAKKIKFYAEAEIKRLENLQ
jgi:hypothetical protein